MLFAAGPHPEQLENGPAAAPGPHNIACPRQRTALRYRPDLYRLARQSRADGNRVFRAGSTADALDAPGRVFGADGCRVVMAAGSGVSAAAAAFSRAAVRARHFVRAARLPQVFGDPSTARPRYLLRPSRASAIPRGRGLKRTGLERPGLERTGAERNGASRRVADAALASSIIAVHEALIIAQSAANHQHPQPSSVGPGGGGFASGDIRTPRRRATGDLQNLSAFQGHDI